MNVHKVIGSSKVASSKGLLPATCYLLPAILLLATLFLSLACTIGDLQGTAIPVGRPANFEVQTATPTTDPQRATLEPEASQTEAALILPLGSAPTHTPNSKCYPDYPASAHQYACTHSSNDSNFGNHPNCRADPGSRGHAQA